VHGTSVNKAFIDKNPPDVLQEPTPEGFSEARSRYSFQPLPELRYKGFQHFDDVTRYTEGRDFENWGVRVLVYGNDRIG